MKLYIYEKYGVISFFFNDRNIVDGGKERLWELCSYLESYETSFSFCAFARADSFSENDLQLLRYLRKNGFVMFDIGIDAGNDSDLLLYNKQVQIEKNSEIFRILKKADIDIRVNFIMLNPFSTYNTIVENYNFLKKNKVFLWRSYISELKLFYGTSLFQAAYDDGLLSSVHSPGEVYEYQCINSFANEYKLFLEWVLKEKTDVLNKTVMNEKTLEHICEMMGVNDILYQVFADKLNAIKDELAFESSRYFAFILEHNIDKGYSEFNAFQNSLEKIFFKIAVLWNKVNKMYYKIKADNI